jgi:hypothetical protein
MGPILGTYTGVAKLQVGLDYLGGVAVPRDSRARGGHFINI